MLLATLAEDLRSAGSATALVLGIGFGAYIGVKAGARLYRDAERDAREVERRRRERQARRIGRLETSDSPSDTSPQDGLDP